MANIKFSVQSPYDQQMEELKRRQRMAEMLQQQSMQPLESQMAGGMVVPISPVQGLAKMLQTYVSNKQLGDIEKRRGEAEQGARTEMLDYLRGFNPERKTIDEVKLNPAQMGESTAFNLPTPQVSNTGQVNYKDSNVTLPKASVLDADQPVAIQTGGPLSRQDQLSRAEAGLASGNPLIRALAQYKYEAAQPKEGEYYDAVQVMIDGKPTMVQYPKAGGAPRILGGSQPKEPTVPSAIAEYNLAKQEGYKGTFEDWKTNQARAGASNVTTTYGAPMAGVDAQGNPVFFQPSKEGGQPSIVPGVRPEAKPPNEGQSNAAGFVARMEQANEFIDNFNPKLLGSIGAAMPFSNLFMDKQQKLFEQAKKNFLTAQLRKESGASIAPSEFETGDKLYFPQYNDPPEVIAAKAKTRAIAIGSMRGAAGNAYKPPANAFPDITVLRKQ